MDNQTHPVDMYVGNKLCLRRKSLQMSLSQLAEKMGISHQQIQKYEKGTTRISASVLYELASILGVSVEYFYEGFNPDANDYSVPGVEDTISLKRKEKFFVLLIEDSATDEVLTRKAIEACPQNVEVYSVHDGVEALQFLRNKRGINSFPRPDIVLLDLNIPKKDGMTVLKEMKRDAEIIDIPVIVLTNTINAHEMYEVYKAYASGFISKSFDINEFRRHIAIMIDYWSSAVVLPSMCRKSENA